MTKTPKVNKYYKEYYEYLCKLFEKASQKDTREYIFTLIRVSGVQDGGWDPFVEAEEALNDFSKVLRRITKSGFNKSALRLALLIYCHAIEISAPYQIFYNLIRCIQGETYVPFPPFPPKPLKIKGPFSFVPPSPIKKLKVIEEECRKVNELELINKINSFFDDEVRNAFYHSDYTITNEEFRICDGGIPYSISAEDLSEKLSRCFAFYQAFFTVYKQARLSFKNVKKIHRVENFEVFEILTNNTEGLIGFRMHFSNNTIAFFERKKDKVHGINVILQKDHINFFVGDLSKLEYKWKFKNKVFRERDTRYNKVGFWKPILFIGNSKSIIEEIKTQSSDKEVQGCLFYIKCTGHESIEFAVKSKVLLFEGKELVDHKVKLVSCDRGEEGSYIYDGTYFINSLHPKYVKRGISQIKSFLKNFEDKDIKFVFKYQVERKIPVSVDKADQKFVVSFPFDDPRNILFTSNFSRLPSTDWKIKEKWI